MEPTVMPPPLRCAGSWRTCRFLKTSSLQHRARLRSDATASLASCIPHSSRARCSMSASDENIVDAQRWLRFADEYLRVAQSLLKSQPPRIACFHAQQAAEKAIKSLFVLL